MTTTQTGTLKEKIRQQLNQLGDLLDSWLNKQRPAPQPVPVPVEQPRRQRRPSR